ncbi:hypothetical protein LK429_11510 [Hoylesella buccalis]|uniref:hypothetical protein n=1 Tax=Hoylesella buccalis TaxID=28127 RepID=UPI001D14CC67|nr:hypothetical protein [Hoylesella buccalis]UEA62658.1 hypothetical protein LK429_11510 [Hoylesella buccalis]UWP50056.1 hypothetical protein NQ518_03120 [Hoylesella buccalis ATCC 35310]
MKIKLTISLTIVGYMLIGLCACTDHKNEEQLRDTANAFAQTYFNWQFNDALTYCTPSSKRWMIYVASQVKQDDVDKLRSAEQGAKSEIKKIHYEEGDSVASVVMKVENFLPMDSIGTVGHFVESATYTLQLVQLNKQWKVRLTELPRPDSPRHDD